MALLALIKSEQFGNTQCDFYKQHNEFFMTREQIGQALEYPEPRKAIHKIHERHTDRLDRFSGVVKMGTPGGEQDVFIYSTKGVYEICRWSRQPKANAFFDWVYEVLEQIRKTGQYNVRNHPDTVLTRKLNLTAKLSKGLTKPQQLELRRIAVKQAAEESGADYSEILQVLELPLMPAMASNADDAGKFLSDVYAKADRYHLKGDYLAIPSNTVNEICLRLGVSRVKVLKALYQQELIQHRYYCGKITFCVKHGTSKNKQRNCVMVKLNSQETIPANI